MLLTRADRLLVLGDSLQTGFGAGTAACCLQIGQVVRAVFPPAAVPVVGTPFVPQASGKSPEMIVNGVPGRKAVDISGGMAAIRANFIKPATKAIVWLGINDAIAITAVTETIGQFSTAQLAIVDDLFTAWGIPYAQMIWVGPWAHGGLDGPAIIAVNAQCVTNAALRGFTFVPVSQLTASGGNSVADGTHPTPQGAVNLVALISPSITYA